MKNRFDLINLGLYPETLPPCFVSKDAKRAFNGIVATLDAARFHNHKTDFVRYNGTKHDGNRRSFGTPNIVSYFHVSSFIKENWKSFEKAFGGSEYSIGSPKLLDSDDDRAIKVPSLSELSARASRNLGYAPFVLKADISQFFPSIYTHSISWAAHGIEASKSDTNEQSPVNKFNSLDFFVRNCQRGNTRGVLVGPDAFRLIAEFISSTLDVELKKSVGDLIVGAVRHVDDYYIGLKSELDALVVLSRLREILASFELNLNDAKTKIYSSVEPINDLWAQRVRKVAREVGVFAKLEHLEFAIDETLEVARQVGSDSPVKILLRAFDEGRIYQTEKWEFVEKYLQRIVHRHPHSIDYVCLLVVKRSAIGKSVDKHGWAEVSQMLISRNLAFNHHHEVLWLLWMLVVCKIPLPFGLIDEVQKMNNSHVKAFLAQAHVDGLLARKPKLGLSTKLASDGPDWLSNLVVRSQGFSGAKFSGCMSSEFEHLASRHIKLVDFDDHLERIKKGQRRAISRTRYGYDDEEDNTEEQDFPDVFDVTPEF